MELGKANYGTSKKIFKMEDGDNVYRILPPMGELARQGIWNKYYAVAWGYKNSQGRIKPFIDPSEKNRSNGMMEVVSAALERTLKLQDQQKKMKEAGASKEQMDKMSDLLMQFNIEKKFYVNAINLRGEIGLLKIGYKAYKVLTGDSKKNEKGLIDELLDQGVDPISSLNDGRFFNFKRTGRGRDTQYTVTVYQESVEVNGKTYKEDKVHKIDDNIISRLSNEAFNLASIFPTPTVEEVARIVSEGPTAVDEILGKSNSSSSEELASDTSTVDTESLTSSAETVSNAPETVDAGSQSPPETQLSKEPEPKQEAVSDSQPIDPDEFLKSMGVDLNNG